MDIFYYWKNYEKDAKAGRIGAFVSQTERLAEFQAGAPDYIWAFKTPRGLKGHLQLLARVRWSDSLVVPLSPSPGESCMFYDPSHSDSVRFPGGRSEEAVNAVTAWAGQYFPSAIAGNFHGANGQRALRGAELVELRKLAAGLEARPFIPAGTAALGDEGEPVPRLPMV
jgi:hypothetical protein